MLSYSLLSLSAPRSAAAATITTASGVVRATSVNFQNRLRLRITAISFRAACQPKMGGQPSTA